MDGEVKSQADEDVLNFDIPDDALRFGRQKPNNYCCREHEGPRNQMISRKVRVRLGYRLGLRFDFGLSGFRSSVPKWHVPKRAIHL